MPTVSVDHDPFNDPVIPVDHDPFDPLAASAGIAPAGTPMISQMDWGRPSWMEQALEQSRRDREAYARGGVREMLKDTEGAQDLAGGFSDAPLGALGIKAFHGSPHDFERFDMSKIGTGEGAQAYGHGLYFAENPETAKSYKDALSGRGLGGAESLADNVINTAGYGREKGIAYLQAQLDRGPHGYQTPLPAESRAVYEKAIDLLKSGWERPPGKTYEVNINADPEHFLDWDKPLSEQPEHIREKFSKAIVPGNAEDDQLLRDLYGADAGHNVLGLFQRSSGGQAYNTFASHVGNPDKAIEKLREAGIPGIKYLDQGSRGDTAAYTQAMKEAADLEAKGHPDWAAARRAEAEAIRGSQTSNYVVFDDKLIDIIKKYGLAGLIAGGAAHLSTQSVDHDPFASQ